MAETNQLPTYHCRACGHTWHPRKAGKPTYCPNCKSRHWEEGLQRAPRSEQLENAARRRLDDLVQAFHIPITDEMRKQALERLGVAKPARTGEFFRVGQVNAGPWGKITDEFFPVVSVAELFGFQNDTDQFWRVNETDDDGTCLTGDDIFPGDIIHFRGGLEPQNDDIVLAMGHDLEGNWFATAKHWHQSGTTDGGKPIIELRSSNPKCRTIRAFQFNVEVEGVAVNVIRRNLRQRKPKTKRSLK